MIYQASSYPKREGEGKGERERRRGEGRGEGERKEGGRERGRKREEWEGGYTSANYCILSHLGREFINKKIM